MSSVGPYDLGETLGAGGSAVVYRARRRDGGREVALKVLKEPEGRQRETALARFQREARAVVSLEHPHIVRVLEVETEVAPRYIAMELLPGGTLRARLDREGALPERDALELVAKIARALHHAHERGFLHRDVKPENVLFDARGEPKLTDFGMTKEIEGAESLTRSGTLLGTPIYLAPEQARGEVTACVTTDVWGLGALLYETVTGQPPFAGGTFVELLDAIAGHDPAPPRTPSGAPLAVAGALALHALAKDPAGRPQTALAFADACGAAPRPRSRRSLAVAAVLAAATLALAGHVATRSREPDAPTPAAAPVAKKRDPIEEARLRVLGCVARRARIPASDLAALASHSDPAVVGRLADWALDPGVAGTKLPPELKALWARRKSGAERLLADTLVLADGLAAYLATEPGAASFLLAVGMKEKEKEKEREKDNQEIARRWRRVTAPELRRACPAVLGEELLVEMESIARRTVKAHDQDILRVAVLDKILGEIDDCVGEERGPGDLATLLEMHSQRRKTSSPAPERWRVLGAEFVARGDPLLGASFLLRAEQHRQARPETDEARDALALTYQEIARRAASPPRRPDRLGDAQWRRDLARRALDESARCLAWRRDFPDCAAAASLSALVAESAALLERPRSYALVALLFSVAFAKALRGEGTLEPLLAMVEIQPRFEPVQRCVVACLRAGEDPEAARAALRAAEIDVKEQGTAHGSAEERLVTRGILEPARARLSR